MAQLHTYILVKTPNGDNVNVDVADLEQVSINDVGEKVVFWKDKNGSLMYGYEIEVKKEVDGFIDNVSECYKIPKRYLKGE